MLYDVYYRLNTPSLITVEATNRTAAKIKAVNQLNKMDKEELIERFVAALDYDPIFDIVDIEKIEEN